MVVKARLTGRGDQDKNEGVRKDSPTVKKSNIKIMTTVSAREKWPIKTSDVRCAFLQSIIKIMTTVSAREKWLIKTSDVRCAFL